MNPKPPLRHGATGIEIGNFVIEFRDDKVVVLARIEVSTTRYMPGISLEFSTFTEPGESRMALNGTGPCSRCAMWTCPLS